MDQELLNQLENIDFTHFWDDSDYALEEYVDEPPTDELIATIEEELGYKLPASYIAMMKIHNGGIPVNTCFPTDEAISWSKEYISITGIMGIGRENGRLCASFYYRLAGCSIAARPDYGQRRHTAVYSISSATIDRPTECRCCG
ncbi:SMI1/KNR4 family protein [Paenibacillus sp. MER TA 81-3]|uniref:SMI1/KNR4 family protein n=1 Tax=Paenibacillus sp. MER TA 81-3 TaxID=2939573 RepID=UPI0034D977DA